MKEITTTAIKTQFVTSDGRAFISMSDATAHQDKLDKLKVQPEVKILELEQRMEYFERRLSALENGRRCYFGTGSQVYSNTTKQ